ncbi:MAG: 50S ribosomal protein L7/L12 [Candidatus Daviesbacteria bacterium]|nr:MAG: 50S ribosomal protein L7/L12 [Candidatus Daviesbacteria bacterium]
MADEPQNDPVQKEVQTEEVAEAPIEEAPATTSDGGTDEGGDSSEVSKTEEVAESAKEEPKAEEAKAEEPKKASKVVSKDLEKIIEQIEKLSVLELADLVHALEDRFGVSASAPVAIAAAGASAANGEAADEGKTTFNVILSSGGANKISVIKAVRELVPTLGLKEAKDLVEGAPKPVLEGVNKESADEAKTKLTAAGGTVELQ